MAATTIKQGENFILRLDITDNDDNPIPAADIKSLVIVGTATNGGPKTWTYPGDANIEVSDGLAELEVAPAVTKKWNGAVTLEVVPSYVDPDYFVSGAQTDVVCFDDLLIVAAC
jgi:type II secretory pathway component HofQ